MKSVLMLTVISLLAVASLLASVDPATAQILTGNIIGTVTDESGAVLPGVTVALASPAALPGGPLTDVTDEKGEYRFTQLSPGTYTLTATLSNFSTYEERDLQVAVSGTTERHIVLKLASVAETITVSGESPMVDPRLVGVSLNLPQAVVENIPVRHYGFHEYIRWAPGVAAADPGGLDGTASVMGSSIGENAYLYDGVNTNNPGTGGIQAGGSPNAVQEVQVVTLGASAEYQIAQGAVYNTVLKQGSNAVHFSGSDLFFPDSLVSKPVKLPCNCSLGQTGYTIVRRLDYDLDAGFPIVKDRLWFYGAFIYTSRIETNPGVDYRLAPTSYNAAPLGKITWQVNRPLRLHGFYNEKPFANPPLPTISRPPATLDGSRADNRMYAVEANYTISNSTLLTVRGTGYIVPYSWSKPTSGDIIMPSHLNEITGVYSGGVPNFGKTTLGRHGQASKINQYIHGERVEHALGFGAQFEIASSTSFSAIPSGVSYADLGSAPDQATFRAPAVAAAVYRSQGAWAEDQLTILNRLTLTLGARFDRMHAISPDMPAVDNQLNPTGATVKGRGDMFTWNVFAPRLGANLKLTQDGKTTLRGNYGRAYREIFLNDFLTVHPGQTPTTLARWNSATNSYSTIISVTDPLANVTVDRNVKAPYTDSYSIGVDHELAANLAVGATYVYKHGADIVGWKDIGGIYGTQNVTLSNGQVLTLYPLLNSTKQQLFERTNGPAFFTRYNGLVLTLQKRLSRRWQADFSYTYGKGTGLVGGNIPGSTTSGQDPNAYTNATGALQYDRSQMFVATGSYQIPKFDAVASASFMGVSGLPFAPQALVSLPQGRIAVNIAPPGAAYRFPTQNLLWLRFNKTLYRLGARRIDAGAELDNALQNRAYDSVATQNLFAPNFAQPVTWVLPRRLNFSINVFF
jgi:hypothetical protein